MVSLALARHAADKRDMEPHIETLADLARDASVVVEFGVRTGVSTMALLEGLPATGRLYSVDVDPTVPDKVPDAVASDPRWTLIIGDDRDPEVVGKLPHVADLVFIDTSHEYHHTIAELALSRCFDPRVIALHDYALADVSDAVHGFVRRHEEWNLEVEWSEWALAVLRRA